MAMITTTLGDMDDSQLKQTTGEIDNDVEHTTWVEYCLAECDGPAHTSNVPDESFYFCAKHVHRSVNMVLKQGVEVFGTAAELG